MHFVINFVCPFGQSSNQDPLNRPLLMKKQQVSHVLKGASKHWMLVDPSHWKVLLKSTSGRPRSIWPLLSETIHVGHQSYNTLASSVDAISIIEIWKHCSVKLLHVRLLIKHKHLLGSSKLTLSTSNFEMNCYSKS